MTLFRRFYTNLRSHFTPAINLITRSNWKYGLLLLCALFLEIRAEFYKLSKEEKQAIIAKNINARGEDLEAEKAWYSAQLQLNKLRQYLDDSILVKNDTVLANLALISDYVEKSKGEGYKKGKAEIIKIQWFEWDLYYISYAFIELLFCIFLANDGRMHRSKGELKKPLMNRFSFILYLVAIPWYLYSLISQIVLRSERLFKEEILMLMLLLFCLLLISAFWYDYTDNSPKAQLILWNKRIRHFLKSNSSIKDIKSDSIIIESEGFKTRRQMADEFEISVDTLRRKLQKKNIELPKGALSPESQAIIRKALGKS